MKRTKLVVSAAVLGSVVLIMVAACALFPDERIEGNWANPKVTVLDVKTAALAGSDKRVISYFFDIAQSAKLRNPRYVWKDTAWENLITNRVNRIAMGYETVLVDSNNSVSLLPIQNNVTGIKQDGGTILFRSSWSYYSKSAVYVVGLADSSAKEVPAGDFAKENKSFVPLEPNQTLNITNEYPEIKARLEQTYLRKADRKNGYKQTKNPNEPK